VFVSVLCVWWFHPLVLPVCAARGLDAWARRHVVPLAVYDIFLQLLVWGGAVVPGSREFKRCVGVGGVGWGVGGVGGWGSTTADTRPVVASPSAETSGAWVVSCLS
jgi:hypothetical protein